MTLTILRSVYSRAGLPRIREKMQGNLRSVHSRARCIYEYQWWKEVYWEVGRGRITRRVKFRSWLILAILPRLSYRLANRKTPRRLYLPASICVSRNLQPRAVGRWERCRLRIEVSSPKQLKKHCPSRNLLPLSRVSWTSSPLSIFRLSLRLFFHPLHPAAQSFFYFFKHLNGVSLKLFQNKF